MSDCVSLIQTNLETLKNQDNISYNNAGAILEGLKKIHDIYISYNLKVQEREIVNAYLLNKDSGILSLLKVYVPLKEIFSVKVECFKLLDDIIDLSAESIQEYGTDIQSVCLLYIRHDVRAEVKKACLVTLSKVLEACRGYQGMKKIETQPLIDSLFFQLCLGNKLPATVKEEILCLIGIIAHNYPVDFYPYQERVLSMYLQELKVQMTAKAKKTDYHTITGCLHGLKEYLYNFSVLCSEDPDNSYFIFDVARKMAVESDKFNMRHESGRKNTSTSSACKAGLQLIAAHAPQFSQFVYEDCINLYKQLMEWVAQDNRDMQKLGRDAVISILKVISDKVMNEYEADRNYSTDIFKFFMEDFRDIFLKASSDDSSKKVHIAVIGYGLFAGPCKLCLSQSQVKTMLNNLIQKSEYEFFSENRNISDSIMILPCFIESAASILSNIDFISDTTILAVEKLIIFQIDKFPKVPTAYNFIVPKSIIHMFVALLPKEDIFMDFLSEIVYHGIVKTCSHPIVSEAENIKDRMSSADENETSDNQLGRESNVKIETYKDYMYLWKNLLNVVQLKELAALNIPLQDRQYLMECIYNQLIISSFDIISKLDLSLQQKTEKDNAEDFEDDGNISSDPFHGIHSNNLTDCYIFSNIVEFLRDLLIESCTELFSKWVYTFGREMISYSSVHPYHSGFYKLIALNLFICNKIDYFKGITKSNELQDSFNSESDVLACFYLFSKFVKEIVIRLQTFKGDLLASCLAILLVLPTEIVNQEIDILVPALKTAFKFGMSYLPVAENAITALEKWCGSILLEKLKPHFPSLLPYLNSYILASASHDACSIPLLKEFKPSKRVHEMSTKLVKKRKNNMDTVVDDPEFQKLQLKILKFLGGLGANNSALLQNAFENIDKVAIAWDSGNRNHLKYAIPFIDMKPEIYFDDFLPRILEVATKSSVRQVKVAACEALHSLVHYLIGRGSQMPEDLHEKYSMEALYKHLFPGLLELACDVEEVTKRLFEPLVFQVIHWFTHSKTIKTPESSVILNVLWDGVTHKENASLRDLSAACIKEYFQWFLKQASQGKLKLIENLLNKLISFSSHPSPYKRLGAAVTFNNIYKIFRSEENLIKEHTIKLLVQFIDSLAIAHNDDKLLGTQKQCVTALEHIEKIIIIKQKHFLKHSEKAKLPSCLEDSSLRSTVHWLFIQCGCIQTECRHKCMDLVIKLSTLIPGVNDPVSFLLEYNTSSQNIFEDIFERALRNKSEMTEFTSFKSVYFWLEALLASLDCYHWAFSDCLRLQNKLDGKEHAELLSSVNIFNIIRYFLTNIAKETLPKVTYVSRINTIHVYTPDEEFKYNRLKCSVLVRLMSLITSMFQESANWFHQQFFNFLWNADLWEVLMLCTVHPSALGFDMCDPEIIRNLPKEISNLLERCLSKEKDFQDFCCKFLLQEKYNLSKLLPFDGKSINKDFLMLSQLFTGYEQLISYKVWSPRNSSDTSEDELIENLLCSAANISCAKNRSAKQKSLLNPVAVTVAEKMLLVAYALGLKVDRLAVKLLNKKDTLNNSEPLVFSHFIKNISEFVSKNPKLFVSTLTGNLSPTSFTEISILLKFIDCVVHTKVLRKKYGKGVIEAFLFYWQDICSWSNSHSDVDSMYSVLSLMLKMLLIDSEVALNTPGFYSTSLYPSYLTILTKRGVTLNFIVQAFNILPFFLESENSDLRECLEEVIVTHFPLRSSELRPGSSSYHTYVSALRKMFSALSFTGCCFLLEILTVLICKESSHICDDDFKKHVIQMVKRTSLDKQQQYADYIFNMVLKENCTLKSETLLAVLEKVLVFLIQNCGTASFINFFLSHIKTIMNMLKSSFTSLAEDIKIVRKIYGFRLMEILYGRLSKDLLHSKESHLVESYLGHKPSNGNELTAEIGKLAVEFKRTSYEKEPMHKELYRKLNCACYNTLIAVVSCTQSETKFYYGILFKENPVKNERIWERLIDKEVCLKFDLEFDASQHRQKKFITMRHKIRSSSDIQESDSQNDNDQIQSSLQLLGSENLGQSSLAEEASKFVFSTENQIFTNEKQEVLSDNAKNKLGYMKKQEKFEPAIELEDDDLNKHECMVSLSCLFNHMKMLNLIPKEPCSEPAPSWVKCLIDNLEDPNVHVNIRLFIARLIVNNAEILEPYAKVFLKPLMNLIVSGVAGRELNYYILDVIITLLSWAPSCVPEENLAYETCELLRFFVRNSDHPRRDIFRNNMEVIKTILELWKDVLEIPYEEIYHKMNDFEVNSKKNVFGIQLLGVVILSNFPPYDIREEARGLSYLNILLKNLNHKYKEVYGSAAEVTSLILKYFVEKQDNIENHPFFINVINQLEKLKAQATENFLYCLNKIHFGCPRIANKFISNLLFLYPSVHGVFKNYILEILLSQLDSIPNAFKDLKLIGQFEDMEKKSEPMQVLSLQALEKLIPSLNCDDLLNILPDIVEIHSQPSVRCRLALYKILFIIYETYVNNDGAKEKEITRLAKETLIVGLADPDQSVRLTVDNFWSNEKRLPSSTKERLIALLKNLYSPATEESFLQYATYLLLERTSNSPDYKRKIFEHPLTQCNFQSYQISTSYSKRHVAMSPFFTQTMSDSLGSSLMIGAGSLAGDGNVVKATQLDQDFPETLDSSKIIKSDTYNWLTDKSLDTFAHENPSEGSFLSSFSGGSEKSYLYALKGDSNFSRKTDVSPKKREENKKQSRSTVWMLKRRFLKDKGDSDSYAKQELRRQDIRKEVLKVQQLRREAQVVLYRKYRIGELPDIEIANSAIIAPIQALALNDIVVAKFLLKSLVLGVCKYVKEDFPNEYDNLLSEIGSCFENILKCSQMRTPSVMSFCLESLNLLEEVSFDAENVFVSSMGSNQQSIGILLFESKLLKGFEQQPFMKRRKSQRPAVSEERNFWMKLAELYRSLNDYDVVNGIFSHTMGQRKENRKALQYEAAGLYFDAYELYYKLYEETSDESDQAEKDFWDKSMLSCLDKLTKWENLETVVSQRFIDPNTSANPLQLFFEDQYVKDNYLPYWVRSKMKQLLSGKQDQTLLDFFDSAKRDEENKFQFENYSEDMALLYILQGKFDIARQFSSNCLNKFLKDWQNWSPLAIKMQQSHLHNLIKYVEIDEFLYLMKNDKVLERSFCAYILKKWQKRYPSLTDPVDIWDDMCSNRQLFFKKILSKIERKTANFKSRSSSSTQDSMELCETDYEEHSDIKMLVSETSALTKIYFAENAAEQKNFPVALKNLKEIYKVSKALNQAVWSKFIQCYCSVNNKRCHFFPEKKLDILLQSLKQLSDLEVKCGTTVSSKYMQSQTFELIGEMFIKNEVTFSSLNDQNKEAIIKVCGSSSKDLLYELLERSFQCLREVISLEKLNKDICTQNTALAHMALANFCNKYLRKEGVDFCPQNIPSFASFPVILTESLLTALEAGIEEAFVLFPYLLQIIEVYPESLEIFKEKVSRMPCWLFIGWINQMIVLLDKPEAIAVQSIIEKITLLYPESIIYAFHLSYENYKFSNTSEANNGKAFVEKMKTMLAKHTLVTEFVAALEQLSVPAIIFKDYVDDIKQLICSKGTVEEINSVFMQMYNNLFDFKGICQNKIGPIQRKFSEEFKVKVLSACGEKGHKLSSPKNADRLAALELLTELKGECIVAAKKSDTKNTKLKNFSPWLNNFRSWTYSTQIEIPGQYTGRCKPLPEYHVKISGFDENVLVLSSITLPRRITIHGNDEKEYKILVKAGEDLRQDARIQQMFSVMNEIYHHDIACAQRHISLKTYKVVPLSNRLGLIEWLDNTVVLQNFMTDGMTVEDKKHFIRVQGSNAAREKFMQWVKKFKSFTSLYMGLFQEKTREECANKFQEIVETVPKNLLTKSFLKLSSSPEAFVALRTRFATSHAVICISQWILGIGDRHLGNFLVDKSSGYEIGIDFGHAFGSATQFLPVPELMPFRLTPQYLQLLDPLKEKGIYEGTMVHALSALQSKYQLLVNMMDIFIKEPTLDWKVFARKQQLDWGENLTDDNDGDWFPKQRIALARKKLEGFNPSHITREELELGHHSKPCFQNMESVCLGSKEYNVRARHEKFGLSPEEQVDCLIDQATDPYLLCLTYCGWNPWM